MVTWGLQMTEIISDWCIVVIYPDSSKERDPGVDRMCTLQRKLLTQTEFFLLEKPINSIFQDFPPVDMPPQPPAKVIPPLDSLSDGWYKEKGPRGKTTHFVVVSWRLVATNQGNWLNWVIFVTTPLLPGDNGNILGTKEWEQNGNMTKN